MLPFDRDLMAQVTHMANEVNINLDVFKNKFLENALLLMF